jgi:hypothetical protein
MIQCSLEVLPLPFAYSGQMQDFPLSDRDVINPKELAAERSGWHAKNGMAKIGFRDASHAASTGLKFEIAFFQGINHWPFHRYLKSKLWAVTLNLESIDQTNVSIP